MRYTGDSRIRTFKMPPPEDNGASGSQDRSQADATSDEAKTVFRLGVKIPPFWLEDAALWFAQIEGQFHVSNITADATKFHHVVSHLDYNIAAEVKDIIVSPPASEKYQKLKTTLINRLSQSRDQRLKQLKMHEELGDRKPSQLLRHMQSLAGTTNDPNDFVRTMWISRLPTNIQTILACQEDFPLDALATLADRVHEVVTPVAPTPHVAAANSWMTSQSATMTQGSSALERQLAELTRQVASLIAGTHSRQHSRSRSSHRGRYRSRSRSRSRSGKGNQDHCWYHNNFGNNASKCENLCTFKKENPNGSR